ncbi:prolyl 4-hydroxylase subunit alpha-1-like [Hyposmocoma kahamanoa]|uniref:prolyl 4-hydroxylase subunit alpha-1-like n=1 Tax=Hyposmocoma kahamanoa TaxID=1477025 RepID=UPI000E6D692A|nr:prolyl 4-hydroxylase subunit alpha-1-like [Hyposmocoma kahamanoa]
MIVLKSVAICAEKKSTKRRSHGSWRLLEDMKLRIPTKWHEFNETVSDNVEEASFWIKKLLLEAPGHPLQDQFMKIIDEYNTILNEEKNSSNEINTNQETFTMEEIIGICLKVTADLYRKACRGETKIVNDVAKRLKCKYLSGNHPYLKLAPVKLEELYLDPDVYMFHDVISDHEIEHIKVISEPRVSSQVFSLMFTLHLECIIFFNVYSFNSVMCW